MSESQYKMYKAAQQRSSGSAGGRGRGRGGGRAGAGGGRKREASHSGLSGLSGDDRSGGEDDLGFGSGMEDYDRA